MNPTPPADPSHPTTSICRWFCVWMFSVWWNFKSVFQCRLLFSGWKQFPLKWLFSKKSSTDGCSTVGFDWIGRGWISGWGQTENWRRRKFDANILEYVSGARFLGLFRLGPKIAFSRSLFHSPPVTRWRKNLKVLVSDVLTGIGAKTAAMFRNYISNIICPVN